MYGNPQRRTDLNTMELRREGGRWLRSLREQAGVSQRDFARLVDTEYYTFISQVKNGRGRIPPDRYFLWASALKIEPRAFVKTLMKYYDPIVYQILFDDECDG
ncbi:helix-turn-helix transcriptional regulator [Methylocystis echinoides]|uniref:helix-turn-helix domain-containing protein n=1 Tax=Methylocystis echinoides TaxID=29468 RepID=UPI00344AFD85